MSTPIPGTSGQWQITGQQQTQQLAPGSQAFVKGVDVTFTTGHNVTASIFIPYASYTTDKVRELVSERAAQLDAVSTLNSSSGS